MGSVPKSRKEVVGRRRTIQAHCALVDGAVDEGDVDEGREAMPVGRGRGRGGRRACGVAGEREHEGDGEEREGECGAASAETAPPEAELNVVGAEDRHRCWWWI